MPDPLLYARDEIVVNDELRRRIFRLCENEAKGKSVVLAARTIRHDPQDYVLRIGPHASPAEPDLTGLSLIVVCDSYLAKDASIVADGLPGASGSAGANGTNAREEVVGMAGTHGAPGTAGQPGSAACGNLTVIAHDLELARITADGGAGGAGGPGGNGGLGTRGRRGKPRFEDVIPPISPGPNGRGGPGGPGSAGGPGGRVTVGYVNGVVAACSAASGAPGPGGAGGLGARMKKSGNALEDSMVPLPAENGPAGSAGQTGQPGMIEEASLTEPQGADPGTYWPRVKTEIGVPASQRWAQWRGRFAEYHFRRHSSARTDGVSLAAAFDEASKALRLDAESTQAQTVLRLLATGVTVLGIPRHAWVPPSFELYQERAIDLSNLISGPVTRIVALVGFIANSAQFVQTIELQRQELVRNRPALASETAAATAGLAASQTREARARQSFDRTKARAAAAQDKLEAARIEVEEAQQWQDIGTVFEVLSAVVQLVVGLYSGNYGNLAGGVAGLIAVASDDGNEEIKLDGLTKTLEVAVEDDDGVVHWLRANDLYDPSPETEELIKKAGSGLGDLVKGTASFLNKKRALTQAATAKYTNLESQYQDLVEQMLLDVSSIQEATFDSLSASVSLDGAKARETANEAQISTLASAASANTDRLTKTVPLLRSLLETARRYQDSVNSYVYRAALAADEWTFGAAADEVPFDLGWTHPDVEEEAFFSLAYPGPGADGDPAAILHYAADSTSAWSAVPQMNYQVEFDAYDQTLSSGKLLVTVDDADVLEGLRLRRTAQFVIPLDAIPAERAELKIERVALALTGARTSTPSVECLLSHGGEMTNRRASGAIVELRAPATDPTIVVVGTDQLLDADDGEPVRQQFWGRSPFARWTLTVEASAQAHSGLDLTDLESLKVAIQYSALVRV